MKSNNKFCLNCKTPFEEGDEYCASCGQKTQFSIHSLREIITDFISNIFYIDSKVWKSLKNAFVPARSTKIYIAGKRKSHLNPFRLFFVSALIFFALLNITLNKAFEKGLSKYHSNDLTLKNIDVYQNREFLLDSLKLDSIRENSLREKINYVSDLKPLNRNSKKRLRDTTFQIPQFNSDVIKDNKITRTDLYRLSSDSIIQKYNITGLKEKFTFELNHKIATRPLEVSKYAIHNFIWGVFLVILLCSVFLKLLYIRHKISWVEAFLLLFELHTFLLFCCSLTLVYIYFWGKVDSDFIDNFTTGITISVVYLLLLLKLYFKQSWIKTIFKAFVFSIFYFIAVVIFLLCITLISTLLL